MDDKFIADRIVRIYHDPEMMVWPENLLVQIAARLEEIPDDWLIDVGRKKVPTGNSKWLIEPLTSVDLGLIREICGSNPPLRGTEADFKQFEARFNEAESKPSWDLRLEYRPSDALVKARNRYNDVMTQHRAQMERLVRDGAIRPITSSGIESNDLSKGRLHVNDVKAYLERCHIAYRMPDANRTDSTEGSEECDDDTAPLLTGAETPPPIPSPAIAAAFAGLNGWTLEEWKTKLGDPPKWLVVARKSKGRKGGDAATWDPVIIAAWLADKGVARLHLDHMFDMRSMKAWRDEWHEKRELLRS